MNRNTIRVPARIRGAGLLVAVVLALGACSAPAASSAPSGEAGSPVIGDGILLDRIKAAGVIRVANPQTSPPYSFRNEANEVAGFDVDFANELAERMGVAEVEFIQGTFDTFIPGVETDKWDVVIAGQAITEERKLKVDFSIPYRVSKVSIFVNESDDTIATLEDLEGKRIAIPAGASQLKMAEEVEGAEIKSYENATLALTDVGLGRADGYLGSRFVGLYLAQQSGLKVKPTDAVLELEQNAMSFKKGEAAFKAEADRIIMEMIADGTLKALSEKWFGPTEDMGKEVSDILGS
jgi:cystine transport system substrate-binding protein